MVIPSCARVEGTPEQINKVLIYWTPLLKLKYKPIREAATYVELLGSEDVIIAFLLR
jgi:hypothetical protein